MVDKFYPFIVQVVPAGGWHAVLLTDNEPFYRLMPMIVWALVESERSDHKVYTTLTGIALVDGAIFRVDERDDFITYAQDNEVSSEAKGMWADAGRRWAAQQTGRGL
jgi:hypothetical protein